ncbi:MAG TPA: oligopeptide transporter, OPT family [Acidobacteriota bacterium]|nr:oligopeptide transporter, OPT family [Acidobacteriota bacterium]HNT17566.1 oligopeptide transporter, OPT family [Acidobacteriota bacterium]
MSDNKFEPYIKAEENVKELTLKAVILGAVLGILFAASSVYLALKVGMTVSASIPIAVLSITLFRLFGRATILENNIVQTTGSAGESIAAGVVFTMPAILLMGYDLKAYWVLSIALLGGVLGVLMMIPLRRSLIVEEHGKLMYPEGTACAQVLMVGEKGGTKAKLVFTGFFIAAVYKFLYAGLKLWREVPEKIFSFYKGGSFSGELSPELLGVGYIIGPRVASIMMSGGILSYLVLIPAIKIFGDSLASPLFPATDLISNMTPKDIRTNYVLYIGAGAVAAAGIMSMIQSLPTIIKAFKASLSKLSFGKTSGKSEAVLRTEHDLSLNVVLFGSLFLVAAMVAMPGLHVNFLSAILIIVFGFFFVTVSSRITGEIGSSSNPISGMTVATLLMTCLIFVVVGWTGIDQRVMALSIGAIVCIAASNGGTTSQDLKTGFLVGATPRYQQISLMVGVVTSALVIGWTVLLLNNSYTTYAPVSYPEFQYKEFSGKQMNGLDGNKYNLVFIHDAGLGVPVGKYLADDDGKLVYREDFGIAGTFPKRFKPASHPGVTITVEGLAPQKGPDLKDYYRVTVTQGKIGENRVSLADGSYLVDPAGGVAYLEQPITKFDAPQARLMNLIIDGILTRKLPWGFVLIGVFIAIFMRMSGVSPLPFAVGVYLPLSTSTPIFVGGIARYFIDKIRGEKEGPEAEFSPGVLLASGYIAGGALCGLLVAGLSGAGFDEKMDFSTYLGSLATGNLFSCFMFAVITAVLFYVGWKAKGATEEKN